jgi:hypothetical protein
LPLNNPLLLQLALVHHLEHDLLALYISRPLVVVYDLGIRDSGLDDNGWMYLANERLSK